MTANTDSATIVQHMCPLCEAGCGLEVHLVKGDVSLIRGDRNDVFSGGFLCPKGTALKGLQHDPDRLRMPLIKRNGQFVEVDFDEAFAEVERLLIPVKEQHGPLACGVVIGNPTVHRTGLLLYVRDLIAAVGSPNVFSAATLDQMPKHLSVGEMFGDFYSVPVPDIERTDLLLIIGANPIVSNGSLWSVPNFRGRAKALRERGGKIITIDPRLTETAKAADQHHHIRPGTDALFLAAVVNVLFDESLVRLGRLEPHVIGLAAVQSSVQNFGPDRVARACGISGDAIRAIARELAAAPSAAVYGRLGTCLQGYGTVTSWLIDVINTITANLDEPGGAMFPKAPAFAGNTTGPSGSGAGVSTGAYHSRVSAAPEVMGQFPMGCLAEEIETPGDGQLRALITIASNVALSAADGPRVERALDQLEVLVCLDPYLNETTRHADVIIPGPSHLEEAHYDVFFSQFGHRNTARFSAAALTKAPEMLHDWETILRLVAILSGQGASVDIGSFDDELTRSLLDETAAEHAEAIMGVLDGQTGI
ncbi:MAG: molybdopterin-dependent oxidoreductase, partial [Acidimicrobiales bacterium]